MTQSSVPIRVPRWKNCVYIVAYGKIAVSSKCHSKEQITNQAETSQRTIYQNNSYLFMAGALRCRCIFNSHSPYVETVVLIQI